MIARLIIVLVSSGMSCVARRPIIDTAASAAGTALAMHTDTAYKRLHALNEHTCNERQARDCFTNAFAEIPRQPISQRQQTKIDCAHYDTYLYCYEIDAANCKPSELTRLAAEQYAKHVVGRECADRSDCHDLPIDMPINVFTVIYATVKKECGMAAHDHSRIAEHYRPRQSHAVDQCRVASPSGHRAHMCSARWTTSEQDVDGALYIDVLSLARQVQLHLTTMSAGCTRFARSLCHWIHTRVAVCGQQSARCSCVDAALQPALKTCAIDCDTLAVTMYEQPHLQCIAIDDTLVTDQVRHWLNTACRLSLSPPSLFIRVIIVIVCIVPFAI